MAWGIQTQIMNPLKQGTNTVPKVN